MQGRVLERGPLDGRLRPLGQDVEEMAAGSRGLLAAGRHQLLGLRPLHVAGQQEGGGLGQDEAVRRPEIFRHAGGVGLEAGGKAPGVAQRRRRGHQHRGHGEPGQRPRRAVALVALDQGLVQGADHAGVEAGQRHQGFGGHRVGLLRHGRGAAAAARHLAHLRLAEEDEVFPHLAEAAGDKGKPAAQLSQGVALAVPGQGRRGQLEFGGQALHHRDAVFAQRRQGAGGPAQLHGFEARAQFGEALAMAPERRQPAGGLEPEGGRRGDLRAGARRHHQAAMGPGLAGERGDHRLQAGRQQVECVAQPQHEAGVEDVLAGRPPVDVGRRPLADAFAQRLDQRRDGHAVRGGGGAEGGEVGFQVRRHLGNARRRLGRDDAQPPLDAGQRRLDGQQGANVSRIGKQRRHRRVAHERPQHGGIERRGGHAPVPFPAPPRPPALEMVAAGGNSKCPARHAGIGSPPPLVGSVATHGGAGLDSRLRGNDERKIRHPLALLFPSLPPPSRHSREGGSPGPGSDWIPAFAGMTKKT